MEDKGKKPAVINIETATKENTNFRKVIWTGKYLQMVLMSLKPDKVIELEVHEDHDQFIRVEAG